MIGIYMDMVGVYLDDFHSSKKNDILYFVTSPRSVKKKKKKIVRKYE